MTETFHIFDEFKISDKDMTTEIRHQKRMKLEPMIFNILRKKYGYFFHQQYKKEPPVTDVSNCILIVERRIHENLEFLLHNAAYFANGWSLGIICSDVNVEFCKKIASPWEKYIHILPFFKGSPSRDQGWKEYNMLMESAEFWSVLPWENVWIAQTDSYFVSRIPKRILKYDYIGAVAAWDFNLMVGGMSCRKPASMKKICETIKEKLRSEDVYLNNGAKKLNMKMPEMPERMLYIWESVFLENVKPVGVHQWWTFLDPMDENGIKNFTNLLDLDITHTNILPDD